MWSYLSLLLSVVCKEPDDKYFWLCRPHGLYSTPQSAKTTTCQGAGTAIFQHQLSLVTQSCLTLYDPRDCSTPGFPVHHQLPELAQTQVHSISDAIQPSHDLSPPPPSALSLPHHQGHF